MIYKQSGVAGFQYSVFTKPSSSDLAHRWEFAPYHPAEAGKGKPLDRMMVRNALGEKHSFKPRLSFQR